MKYEDVFSVQKEIREIADKKCQENNCELIVIMRKNSVNDYISLFSVVGKQISPKAKDSNYNLWTLEEETEDFILDKENYSAMEIFDELDIRLHYFRDNKIFAK